VKYLACNLDDDVALRALLLADKVPSPEPALRVAGFETAPSAEHGRHKCVSYIKLCSLPPNEPSPADLQAVSRVSGSRIAHTYAAYQSYDVAQTSLEIRQILGAQALADLSEARPVASHGGIAADLRKRAWSEVYVAGRIAAGTPPDNTCTSYWLWATSTWVAEGDDELNSRSRLEQPGGMRHWVIMPYQRMRDELGEYGALSAFRALS
jgi:hypothetical protein